MPKPKEGESKKQYIPRCVSYLVKKEGKKQKQALAICFAMWNGANEGNDIEEKIQILINEATITTDVEQNLTPGNVDVLGMKYKKKKRKNKLTGKTVVYEEK